MDKLILNERQKIAVFHNTGPMIVLAGPGSGKTTVILNRINHLIKNYGIRPNEILVITFTKYAAGELKTRFQSSFGEASNIISFNTFHSYFFKIIRAFYKYSLENILKETEKFSLIKKIVYSLGIVFDNEDEFLQNIINNISLLKNELIEPELYNPINCKSDEFLSIFYEYEKKKAAINKIDFDDMLLKCYHLLKENEHVRTFWANKHQYILIDEFQDINKVQYECIKLLLNDQKNIFVVGDDDQSIYKFRGSRPDFLLNFSNELSDVKKVVLNVNYRSTDEIISFCNKIIKENENRYLKDTIGTGKKLRRPILLKPFDVSEEAKYIVKKIQELTKTINLEDIAIIYRTNIQSRAIIEALSDFNIPYQVKDEIFSIYDHWITKDIFAYLSLALNQNSSESFIRIVNKPKRYVSKEFIKNCSKDLGEKDSLIQFIYSHKDAKNYHIEKLNQLIFGLNQMKQKNTYDAIKYIIKNIGYEDYLQEYADFKRIKIRGLMEILYEVLEISKKLPDISDYLTYIKEMSDKIKSKILDDNKSGVLLSTIHSVKGLEFNSVFVISCVEGVIPHEKSTANDAIEEERRLFYVGITRAKERLYLSVIQSKHESNVKPSRFLKNLTKKGRK